MIVQDEALVLRVRDYSETSQIAALWTSAHGRVTGIAKGIRRDKRAAFDGPFEPGCRYEVGFYPRPRGEGLCILSEASLSRRFERFRNALETWWAFSEAAEAVLLLTQEMDPHAGVLEALQDLLVGGSLSSFQMRLLETTGHAPAVDRCAGCGAAIPEKARSGFAFWVGGAVCGDCERGAGPVAVLPSEVRAVLRAGGAAEFQRPVEALLGRHVSHLAGESLSVPACRERSRRALQRLRKGV